MSLKLLYCIVDGIIDSLIGLIGGTLHSLVSLVLSVLHSFVSLVLSILHSLVNLSLACLYSGIGLCLSSIYGSILCSLCISFDGVGSSIGSIFCILWQCLYSIDDVGQCEGVDIQLLQLLGILIHESLELACISGSLFCVATFDNLLQLGLNGFDSLSKSCSIARLYLFRERTYDCFGSGVLEIEGFLSRVSLV